MSRSLPNSSVTPQDALSVTGRHKMARVTDASPRSGQMTPDDTHRDTRVSDLLLEAARLAHGKLESAAGEVGKDRANFTRDVKKWAEILEALGPIFLANLGASLVRDYGLALETEEQRGERILDTADACIKEARQLIRHLAKERG